MDFPLLTRFEDAIKNWITGKPNKPKWVWTWKMKLIWFTGTNKGLIVQYWVRLFCSNEFVLFDLDKICLTSSRKMDEYLLYCLFEPCIFNDLAKNDAGNVCHFRKNKTTLLKNRKVLHPSQYNNSVPNESSWPNNKPIIFNFFSRRLENLFVFSFGRNVHRKGSRKEKEWVIATFLWKTNFCRFKRSTFWNLNKQPFRQPSFKSKVNLGTRVSTC